MMVPQEVSMRALALCVFWYRSSYERRAFEDPLANRGEMQDDIDDMAVFSKETGLDDWLSPVEASLFGKPIGKWHAVDIKECSWRIENLVMLFWALYWIDDLPPVHQDSRSDDIGLSEKLDEGIDASRSAKLRPQAELEQMNSYLESIRLRLRTPDDFEGIPWLAGKAEGFGGGAPIDGDLPLDGRPVREASAQLRTTTTSIAMERHKALQWVLNYEVDLDAPAPEV